MKRVLHNSASENNQPVEETPVNNAVTESENNTFDAEVIWYSSDHYDKKETPDIFASGSSNQIVQLSKTQSDNKEEGTQ